MQATIRYNAANQTLAELTESDLVDWNERRVAPGCSRARFVDETPAVFVIEGNNDLADQFAYTGYRFIG